jgi:CheY-like chemotaxis protein/glycine cleavage system H lipoate-binding protein
MTAKILLVDDEEIIHASVRKGLKKGQWIIDSAMNGREALALLREAPYDLVITDLMMPGMDGLELLGEIRKSIGDVPVIMLTGYATIRTAVKAMEIGAFDYIAKPPTRRELMGVVTRALRSRSLDEGASAAVPTNGETRASLRDHSWAVIEADGAARIGVEPTFLRAAGTVTSLDLPDVGDAIDQGRQCALLTTDDGADHKVWSPLSGTVLERNGEIEGESLDLIRTDPYGRGWLIRIRPTRLDDERPHLVPGDA